MAGREVTFRELDPTTLDAYLASGEWRDRAGAYAIQGLGSILVERVEGDFSNVSGCRCGSCWSWLPSCSGTAAGRSREKSNP